MNDTTIPAQTDQLTPVVTPIDPSTDISTPVTPQNTPVMPPKKSLLSKSILIGAMIFLFLFIVVFIFYMRTAREQQQVVQVTPTPTIILTPTPPQKLSAIASTSAFAAFQDSVASYSSKITSFTMQDGTLTPPIFELNLGLTN